LSDKKEVLEKTSVLKEYRWQCDESCIYLRARLFE
jgi:hypothetical protein